MGKKTASAIAAKLMAIKAVEKRFCGTVEGLMRTPKELNMSGSSGDSR
jgi:hypothetical protein